MKRALIFAVLMAVQGPLFAQDAANAKPKAEIAYYPFDPDIVTNYVTPSTEELGYVRVSMQLMLNDKKYIEVIEHHEPLLLDIIVDILSKETADKHKSLTGREEIRLKLLSELKEVMRKETGQDVIRDVLYSKYLYHGPS
ncbi:flagellar basal body-associated FliL family protein [Rheinheimera sp.]|uniref:flagellar basal body-associated FliL family protein n=1 Tax=Rheinheimera sp. TaxID=1869214 RepID=UPI00307DD712